MFTIAEIKKAADLSKIAEIAAQIWPDTYGKILSQSQIDYMMQMMYSAEVMQREFQAGIRFFLLLDGQTPIGFLSMGDSGEKGVAKLHKLYLLSGYHRQGLGSKMLQFAIAEARCQGYKSLYLNVNKENSRAIKAYNRNGFATLRAEKNPIGQGFYMDDFVMEHAL